ncbi:MAG: APC family permease [Acidobacteriota bacterium]
MSKKKKAKAKTPDEIAAEKLGEAPQPPPPTPDQTEADAKIAARRGGVLSRVFRVLVGKPKNLLDPRVFQHLSLIAFLAWVGLGADGLSSSCYGPEEAYRALGSYHYLGVYLVIAVVVTVFVISATYSQIIERFPTGGGGYLVASKLLGPASGLVAGAALVVDYALTIAISVANGADQVFSLLNPSLQPLKLWIAILAILLLMILNLRGVKESVQVLLPIFLTFVVTHLVLILYGLLSHAPQLPMVMGAAVTETRDSIGRLGFLTVALLVLRAYSLGGGTFTGIEAVSNGLPILAEPRVETGKRTMRYMSVSLAFTAGGILFCYMLLRVQHVPGKTFNAVLFEGLTAAWGMPSFAKAFVGVALVAEAALLFVAAQAGFLGGPQMLASMAVDSWMPHRFSILSDRLVTRNGVLVMGSGALAFVLATRARVSILVVLYSINVFLTFTLSQLGMARLYYRERAEMKDFGRKLGIMLVGLTLTSAILVATLTLKFMDGGWLTVLITSGVIAFCIFVKRHYNQVRAFIRELDQTLLALPPKVDSAVTPGAEPKAPTAAILVSGYNGLGIHTFYTIIRLFPNHYRNFIFISAAIVDSEKFKGKTEMEALRKSTLADLEKYVAFADHLGFYAESRMMTGTDAAEEVERMAREIMETYPRTVFFAGRLVFSIESFFTRLLHNETGLAIQRRLHFGGVPMVILPIRAR